MNRLRQLINKQIEYNSGKNLFAKEDGLFRFIMLPDSLKEDLKSITKSEENVLINIVASKSLEAFYRLNQFFYFSNGDINNLKSIYSDLFQHLKSDNDLSVYEEKHYNKLRTWLSATNPFAQELYSEKEEILQDVVCEEYNSRFQLDLLHIDLKNIEEPVLDIGCGKIGNLVNYLRKSGIEAFGFDRSTSAMKFCTTTDWFDYHYGKEKWGTIISNLSFSNHFNHHHLRSDGNYTAYAQTYMQILHSIKPGGAFHYAPGLPFIEKYLDDSEFEIKTNDICNAQYKTTTIKKNFK